MLENNEWTAYTPENSGLPYRNVRDISIDNAGNLWLSADELSVSGRYLFGSLYKFDGVEWQALNLLDFDHLNHLVSAIGHTSDGKMWIATSPDDARFPLVYEISVFDGETWTKAISLDGTFPLTFVLDIQVDDQDRTWLASGSGLIVVEPF